MEASSYTAKEVSGWACASEGSPVYSSLCTPSHQARTSNPQRPPFPTTIILRVN